MSFFMAEGKPIRKPVLIGLVVSAAVTALLIALCALTILMMPSIPYGWIDYIVAAIEGFGVLIGAYVACAVFKSRGLLIGALCGGIAALITLCVGLSVDGSNIGMLTLIRCALLILCGVGGGIAGVNRKERVRIK